MKTNLKKVYSKLPNQRVNLEAQKVALGLIDNLDYDYNVIESESSLMSYLAYEWHEEKFDAAREAWMTLNDEYKFSASGVLRFEEFSGDIEKLNEIKAKAEELGLEADDVYSDWNPHMERLMEMKEADDQYKENEREFNTYFGN
jgi:hypothetical protein